jgi:DNA polymerase-3 subunit gamma/tau
MVDANALTPGRWPEGFEMFHFTGILHNIALNLALIDSRGSALQFCIEEKDATLLNERHPAQLSQALSQQLGQSVTATITVSDHDGRTPSQCRAALAATRLAEAEQAISSDQALNGLIAAFDGHIIPGSIRPNLADGEAVTLPHDAD